MFLSGQARNQSGKKPDQQAALPAAASSGRSRGNQCPESNEERKSKITSELQHKT